MTMLAPLLQQTGNPHQMKKLHLLLMPVLHMMNLLFLQQEIVEQHLSEIEIEPVVHKPLLRARLLLRQENKF